MQQSTFFDNWAGLLRVIVVGTLAYVALVVLLRTSGKRTLSKMNAFDFVVTVALGSTLATIILSKDVALLEGIVAFGLLIALQFVITWLSVRFAVVGKLVKSEPTLLFYQGQFLRRQMRHNRIVESEVLAAVRSQGMASLDDAEAVILEADGSFTTVHATRSSPSALADVSLPPGKRTAR